MRPPTEEKKASQSLIWPLSKFQILSVTTLIVSAALFWVDIRLSLAAIAVYLLLAIIAPYSFRLGLFLPVVFRAGRPQSTISLTFDDGPDPELTPRLLQLLADHHVKAAFFIVGSRAQQYPHLIKQIVDDGHEIGNHSQHHDPILMLRRFKTIFSEIEECRTRLYMLGIRSFAFRPPVGITNPKLFRILLDLGLYCVGFSCRPNDFGNRFIRRLSTRVLKKIKPGDIVLLHDKKPNNSFSTDTWIHEIEAILKGIKARGYSIVPLSQLINRPVMRISQADDASVISPASPVANVLNYLPEISRYLKTFQKHGLNQNADPLPSVVSRLTSSSSVLEIPGLNAGDPLIDPDLVGSYTLVTDLREQLHCLTPSLTEAQPKADRLSSVDNVTSQFERQYDLILTSSGFFFEPDIRQAFHIAYTLLNRGGFFLFQMPRYSIKTWLNAAYLALNTGIAPHMVTASNLTRLLEHAGFVRIQISSPDPGFLNVIATKE